MVSLPPAQVRACPGPQQLLRPLVRYGAFGLGTSARRPPLASKSKGVPLLLPLRRHRSPALHGQAQPMLLRPVRRSLYLASSTDSPALLTRLVLRRHLAAANLVFVVPDGESCCSRPHLLRNPDRNLRISRSNCLAGCNPLGSFRPAACAPVPACRTQEVRGFHSRHARTLPLNALRGKLSAVPLRRKCRANLAELVVVEWRR